MMDSYLQNTSTDSPSRNHKDSPNHKKKRSGISAKATRRFSLTSVEGVEPDADAWVESQAGGG